LILRLKSAGSEEIFSKISKKRRFLRLGNLFRGKGRQKILRGEGESHFLNLRGKEVPKDRYI